MAFYHRRFLLSNSKQEQNDPPPCQLPPNPKQEQNDPPRQFPPNRKQEHKDSPPWPPNPEQTDPLPSPVSMPHDVFPSLIVAVCFLGAVFLFLAYFAIRTYQSKGNTTTNSTTVEDENVNAENETHGPAEEVDHPIWYIRTVGLPETAIDSITTFKYKRRRYCSKENSDCCVCLNEFQEDESLRLLPNCGHAFHVPCIDTWLRSHTNCPLCRAPVVETGGGDAGCFDEVELVVAGSSGPGPTEENRVDNESADFIESDNKRSEVFSRNGEFGVSSDHLGESQ